MSSAISICSIPKCLHSTAVIFLNSVLNKCGINSCCCICCLFQLLMLGTGCWMLDSEVNSNFSDTKNLESSIQHLVSVLMHTISLCNFSYFQAITFTLQYRATFCKFHGFLKGICFYNN